MQILTDNNISSYGSYWLWTNDLTLFTLAITTKKRMKFRLPAAYLHSAEKGFVVEEKGVRG
jgi:hypothetical protein